ncbi:MAG: hypothetical protein ACM3UZ_07040 [Acidobacteriota bacterium]
MEILRRLLIFILVLIIVGGLGYIGYSEFYMKGMKHGSMNMTPSTTEQPKTTTTTPETKPNATAAANRDQLQNALTTVDQAMDLITVDPYSKTTVPNSLFMPGNRNGQYNQGTGTINIYPDGNSSVNVTPPKTGTTTDQNTANTNNTGNASPNTNYVFDENRLIRLHSAIFNLAQGRIVLDELNADLSDQAAAAEANPPDQTTWMNRYNAALQNRNKLESAIRMLNQINVLVNDNPYASPNGYQYDTSAMEQLHRGIYNLAQGMRTLNKLDQDFTNQLGQASAMIQTSDMSGMMSMPGMNMPSSGLLAGLNMGTILTVLMVIIVMILIISILNYMMNLLRAGRVQPSDGPREGDSL